MDRYDAVILFWVLVIVLALGLCGYGGGSYLAHKQTGTGEKVGTVIRIYSKGFWFKTNEIEIVRGGMNGGSGAFSTKPACITITTPEMLKQAQEAFDAQQEVVVSYTEMFWSPVSSEGDCGDAGFLYATSIRNAK